MAESNYKPNSNKYKEEQSTLVEHRAEKVTTEPLITKKKGTFSKIIDIFLPESVEDTRQYIITGVILPGIRRIITETVDGIVYGSKGNPGYNKDYSGISTRNSRKVDNVSYGQGQKSSTPDTRSYTVPIYANRGDAELVLDNMNSMLEEYGYVSILDMLDLAGVTGGNYTDAKYGWQDLRNARVIRVNGGYEIELPKALPFD